MKNISKIHLLVHPGFFEIDAQLSNVFDDPRQEKRDIEFLRKLFEKYSEKFSHLPNDELLVAFTYDYRGDLKKKMKAARSSWPSYTDLLHELKKQLEDRIVVFSESAVTHAADRKIDLTDVQEKLQRILQARGYEISEHVALEACGELINNCVEVYGEAFRRGREIPEPLLVDSAATDRARYGDAGMKGIARKNEHIRYK